ncbi:MAG TPA: 5-(carboxyamino)imidazole ribonucleotide mutase [Armatimonadota bacterium]|jgi:5-(carboxyamino)imidazole ribonucleotide mutase
MALKAALVMGSDSDWPALKPVRKLLRELGVEVDVRVISAHRTPAAAHDFGSQAEANGVGVILAAAGGAAHLAGVMASLTVLPVVGIPVKSKSLDGLDSLLSTVQMPPGVPVATVGINAAENAALLAAQILSIGDPALRERLREHKRNLAEKVARADQELSRELDEE